MNTKTQGMNVIIWSKDRPIQLNLCLESLYKNYKEFKTSNVTVVYRAMSEKITKSYDTLRSEWIARGKQEGFTVNFIYDTNFYLLTLMAFGYAAQTMFVVDDQVFVREFSTFDEPVKLQLANPERYWTVSLRLDPTKTYCYPINQDQAVPQFITNKDEYVSWAHSKAQHDWGYAASLDGNIYLTQHIRQLIQKLNPQQIVNPNALEMVLNGINKQGQVQYPSEILAYKAAKTVTVPVNKVQTMFDNRSSDTHTVDGLLDLWLQGRKIDVDDAISKLIDSNSPHTPIEYKFVQR